MRYLKEYKEMNRLIKVGITGGIGSGKSYIADIFHTKYNIPIYNSDNRSKYLMVNDPSVGNKIIKYFGEDSYIDNQINKEKFNKLLFENKDNLALMNSIIIPAMELDFNNFCKNIKSPYVLKESAILLETDSYKSLGKIICVVADMELRTKRVTTRDNMNQDLFFKKVANQSSDEEKIAKSDYIIYNNGGNLEGEIEKIIYNKK